MDHHNHEEDLKLLNQNFQSIKKLQRSQENWEDKSNISNSDRISKLIDESISRIEEINLPDEKIQLLGLKTTLLYERSKLLTELKKPQDAEELLAKCLKDIKDFITSKELFYLGLRIINHYAHLLSKREDFSEARKILEFGEEIYRKAGIKNEFWNSYDLFAGIHLATTNATRKLEHLVTNNLRMLGFVYTKLGLHDKFAEYHHQVLARELEFDDKDPLVWSFESTTLGIWLSGKKRFEEAKNHLEAAEFVLKKYEDELKALELSDAVSNKLKSVEARLMIVAKGWVKYSLHLFTASITKITNSLSLELSRTEAAEKNEPSSSLCKDKLTEINEENYSESDNKLNTENKLLFKLNIVSFQVTTTFIENSCEAYILFNYASDYVTKIQLFFTADYGPVDYFYSIIDLSELYWSLAFFAEDFESQYSLQKLREYAVEQLSTNLRLKNPQYYAEFSVQIFQELAEIQLELLGLNMKKIYSAMENAGDARECKIESLKYLHSRVDNFKNISTDFWKLYSK